MRPVIITAAICGAEVTKRENPSIPYTVREITEEAKAAVLAGASIIHLHVREDDGTPTQSPERFRECINAIRQTCGNVIIQPSTGGAVGMSDEERVAVLGLSLETASLDCGTLNFGENDIFINTEKTIRFFAKKMREKSCKPEIEVFDKGMIETAIRLQRDGLFAEPLHFNLVMGVRGGIGATLQDIAFLTASLPAGSTYTLTGVGSAQVPIAAIAAASGGNIRVGFEDNVHLEKGVLAKSNGELVTKAARIARELGRPIASPDEAREILNIRPLETKRGNQK